MPLDLGFMAADFVHKLRAIGTDDDLFVWLPLARIVVGLVT